MRHTRQRRERNICNFCIPSRLCKMAGWRYNSLANEGYYGNLVIQEGCDCLTGRKEVAIQDNLFLYVRKREAIQKDLAIIMRKSNDTRKLWLLTGKKEQVAKVDSMVVHGIYIKQRVNDSGGKSNNSRFPSLTPGYPKKDLPRHAGCIYITRLFQIICSGESIETTAGKRIRQYTISR